MWQTLDKPWQEAFKQGWDAFKHDTIPIGAVIYKDDHLITTGKNRIFDQKSDHPLAGLYMAHAEMTAMMNLKPYTDEAIRTFTLYTTMEPCPMCFSTMAMMHIMDLKYAAKDGFAGSTELKDKTWYLKQKTMNIQHMGGQMQAFQLILQTAFECVRNHKYKDLLLGKWQEDDPKAVGLGQILHEEGYFKRALETKAVDDVYNELMKRYEEDL